LILAAGGLALVTSKKISIALLLSVVVCALEIGLGQIIGYPLINPATIILLAGIFAAVVGLELNAKKGAFDV
jgi:hypothetical protein